MRRTVTLWLVALLMVSGQGARRQSPRRAVTCEMDAELARTGRYRLHPSRRDRPGAARPGAVRSLEAGLCLHHGLLIGCIGGQ